MQQGLGKDCVRNRDSEIHDIFGKAFVRFSAQMERSGHCFHIGKSRTFEPVHNGALSGRFRGRGAQKEGKDIDRPESGEIRQMMLPVCTLHATVAEGGLPESWKIKCRKAAVEDYSMRE